MEREKQMMEESQSSFVKRIGNTTFKVRVYFAENTTDTLEDKIMHLLTVSDGLKAAANDSTQKKAM